MIYTSVNKLGNKIVFRGIASNGSRISRKIDFSPVLYVKSNSDSCDRLSIFNERLKEISFPDITTAEEFIQSYKDVDNFSIYGNDDFVSQFIQKNFPDKIDFKIDDILVAKLDIEVMSDQGFPDPQEANHEIVSITYKKSNDDAYHVFGLKDFDESLASVPVKYYKCSSEKTLIARFLSLFEEDYPDVISGWYVDMFDIPYIINRTMKIFDHNTAKRISPWKFFYRNKDGSYNIFGIQQLDYMKLFKKFDHIYGPQESYKLDHIAFTVLEEKKLSYDEEGSLHNLYEVDHDKYILYNIKDVQLVDKLDEKLELIELAIALSYSAGVNYQDSFGTVKLWDNIIYRYVEKKGLVIPPMTYSPRESFGGAYVKQPITGLKEYIVSFDVNSMYPNIIVQYNMSPETLILDLEDVPSGVDFFLNEDYPLKNLKKDHAIAVNGSSYRKDVKGIIPEIVEEIYDERKTIKKKMLDMKKNGGSEHEINKLKNQQMILKIQLNSLYGAMGNNFFRYYRLQIAEGITTTGQYIIRTAEKALNKEMNRICKLNEMIDHVIAMDTDSCYVCMSPIIEKIKPKNPVKFLSKISSDYFEPFLIKEFAKAAEKTNAYVNRMEMGREVIASKGFWTGKKRYVLNVIDDEGVVYDEPKLKIMGFEAIKSSTPNAIRQWFKEAFKICLEKDEETLIEFISKIKKDFHKLAPEDISSPRGVTDMQKYQDTNSIYKKGTPIHVRASLLYNHLVRSKNLTNVYEVIKSGEKIKFCYLKLPNPIGENVIGYPKYLPKEFDLHEFIDYNLQLDKAFIHPIEDIAKSIGWNIVHKNKITSFFS